jgi:uncharacterized membrane protein
MRHRNLDLLFAITIAVLNIVLALLPVHEKIIQGIIALPLVFIVPGYMLAEAVFQKHLLEKMKMPLSIFRPGTTQPLNTLEYFTLSIGLSITCDILGGFLLNLFPIGLTTTSWLTFFGIFTLLLALVVVLQRLQQRQNWQSSSPRFSRIQLSLSQLLLFGLAGIIVVFSILFSIRSATQQPYPGFTQLWLLPPAQRESSCVVQLGVQNFEGTDVTYRVTMQVNGVSRVTWVPVALAPQQTWNRSIPIAFDSTTKIPSKFVVEVQLYRMNNPTVVYRHVHVLLLAAGKSQGGKTVACEAS